VSVVGLSWPKTNLIWPLRAVAAMTLIGPALLFGFASWTNYQDIDDLASERLDRTLDIVLEHAQKAFQTVERTIAEINEVLRGVSDDEIKADEARFSSRFKRTQLALPQLESIWAFDRNGYPLASSTVLPVPRGLNNSDRDYFRAQAEHDAGTYLGEIVQARIGNSRFFVVSGRRTDNPDGPFNGVIGLTVLPGHFHNFYARLAKGGVDSFGLIRADGAFLARYPQVLNRPERVDARSDFALAIQRHPEAGTFTGRSQLDGIERRVAYRRIPGTPAYALVGSETAALAREWRDTMLGQLAFGLPATLAMFGLALFALRRTERFQTEAGRRELAEAALKQAQRLEAVGQLTGGVAHDFNNLLMVVTGSVERLRRYPAADERQRRAIDAIDTAARRGASLTRQLLSFSRRQTHEPTPLDLGGHLAQLQEMLRSSLRGDIAIDLQIPDGLWPIRVDLSEFELAILNIAVNARDAMASGGRITIAAQNLTLRDPGTIGISGDYVALSIADTGTGIPSELLAHVFEPFFTTKEVGKGTGLGLSQVYGFARQSGGTATVTSKPGQGTVVTLYLPRNAEAVPVQTTAPETPATRPRAGRGRILLVEDNADVAEITKGRLEELGYEVAHAPDASVGMAMLADSAPAIDLLVCDIVMPGDTNGLDLARVVRRKHQGKLPVVLATGYSDVAQSAADEGFIVLRKPYSERELREGVARAIRASRLKVVA
jgi:two-component system NtrC family sensor kinase